MSPAFRMIRTLPVTQAPSAEVIEPDATRCLRKVSEMERATSWSSCGSSEGEGVGSGSGDSDGVGELEGVGDGELVDCGLGVGDGVGVGSADQEAGGSHVVP